MDAVVIEVNEVTSKVKPLTSIDPITNNSEAIPEPTSSVTVEADTKTVTPSVPNIPHHIATEILQRRNVALGEPVFDLVGSTQLQEDITHVNISYKKANSNVQHVRAANVVTVWPTLKLTFGLTCTNEVSAEEARDMAIVMESEVLTVLSIRFGNPNRLQTSVTRENEPCKKQRF